MGTMARTIIFQAFYVWVGLTAGSFFTAISTNQDWRNDSIIYATALIIYTLVIRLNELTSDERSVLAECPTCLGSGLDDHLLRGNVGLTCKDCLGTGCIPMTYKLFSKRRSRKNVDFVQSYETEALSADDLTPGMVISYEKFLAGKRPLV